MRSSFRALVALPLIVVAAGCTVDSTEPVVDPPETPPEAASSVDSSKAALAVEPLTSRGQGGFASGVQVLTGFCGTPFSTCTTADVNGDGRADFVSFTTNIDIFTGRRSTSVAVSVANPDGTWATPRPFGSYALTASPEIGDVDGDGRDDVVLFVRGTGEVWVMRSNGVSLAAARSALAGFCTGNETCKVGDFNGDGRADVARFLLDTVAGDGAGDVFVALSGGATFGAPTRWATDLGHAGDVIEIGDVNGDRRADVVRFLKRDVSPNAVFVARSSGAAFDAPTRLINDFCAPGMTCKVGNVDGAGGRADVVGFMSSLREGEVGIDVRNDVYTALARPSFDSDAPIDVEYGPTRARADNFCPKNWTCMLADTDADGRDDLVAFSRSDSAAPGVVRVATSTFGRKSTYVIDHERLGALSTEGSSDKPLLVNIGFRATLGPRPRTIVFSNTYNEMWGAGLAVGERRIIPAQVGELGFSDVAAPTIDELVRGVPLEVVGSLVIAAEKDLSAADSWRAITEELKVLLRSTITEAFQNVTPILLALDPDAFKERLKTALKNAKSRIFPMVDEFIGLYASGFLDPDDLIGVRLFAYPAIDKEAAALIPASPQPDFVTLAPLGDGEGFWGSTASLRSGSIHWRLETRPRFVSFTP